MNFLKSYWREVSIALLAIGMGLIAYSLKVEKSQRVLAQTNATNAQVEFIQFKKDLVQAQNKAFQSHEEMLADLSSDLQDQIKANSLKTLTTIRGEMAILSTKVDNIPAKTLEPAVWETQDRLMEYIRFNAKNPSNPVFSYKTNPIPLTLEGALTFDPSKGQTKFLFHPQIKNDMGLNVQVNALTLTPGPEFNQWVSRLQGKEVYIPTMPKWTVSGLAGREYLKELPGGYRNAFGADATYNFRNNVGVGGGFIGSTTFIKLSYSFGKP